MDVAAPGITYRSVASISTSAWTGIPTPIAATRSSSITTSAFVVSVAVTTVPPLMRVLMMFDLLPFLAHVSWPRFLAHVSWPQPLLASSRPVHGPCLARWPRWHHPTAVGGGKPCARPTEYILPGDRTDWHVAQVNIALPRAARCPRARVDFVAMLAPINALADGSPGFVWRLQGGRRDRDPRVRRRPDPREPVGVGDDRGARGVRLRLETRRGPRRRRDWFEQMAEAHLALWWIPAGGTPTVEEAERRLAALRERGRPRTPSPCGSRSPPPARTSRCPRRIAGGTRPPGNPREMPRPPAWVAPGPCG